MLLAYLFFICTLFNLSTIASAEEEKRTCSPSNCNLPLCKCADTLVPGNLNLKDVPMMIMLTFNGILKKKHTDHLKKILNPIFKNPNGCPVQATFFVSEGGSEKTDYCLVQKLFNNNNEIGVGSVDYR